MTVHLQFAAYLSVIKYHLFTYSSYDCTVSLVLSFSNASYTSFLGDIPTEFLACFQMYLSPDYEKDRLLQYLWEVERKKAMWWQVSNYSTSNDGSLHCIWSLFGSSSDSFRSFSYCMWFVLVQYQYISRDSNHSDVLSGIYFYYFKWYLHLSSVDFRRQYCDWALVERINFHLQKRKTANLPFDRHCSLQNICSKVLERAKDGMVS